MTPVLRSLLQIPQNLRIYERLAKLGVPSQPASAIEPVEEDWRSLRRIFQNYPDLFQRLLWRANNGTWWNIITQHWLSEAKLAQERETWLLQFVHWLGDNILGSNRKHYP